MTAEDRKCSNWVCSNFNTNHLYIYIQWVCTIFFIFFLVIYTSQEVKSQSVETRWKRKSAKNDFQVFDLSKWKDGRGIYWHFEELGLGRKMFDFWHVFKIYLWDIKINVFKVDMIFLIQERNRNLRSVQNFNVSQLTSKLFLCNWKS